MATLNMNGYEKRLLAIEKMVLEDIEIITLQETHKTWVGNVKRKGYLTFESTSVSEPRRGVALLIKEGIFDEVKTAVRHLGSEIFVTAKLDKLVFLIGSVHIHFEKREYDLNALADFMCKRKEPFRLVAGDFNTDVQKEEEGELMKEGLLPKGCGIMSMFLQKTSMVCGRYTDLTWTKGDNTYDYILVSAEMSDKLQFTCVRLDVQSSDLHTAQAMMEIDVASEQVNQYICEKLTR